MIFAVPQRSNMQLGSKVNINVFKMQAILLRYQLYAEKLAGSKMIIYTNSKIAS